MKKKCVLLLVATMTILSGCGKDKIKTETIEIPQYKNVKVAEFEMSKDILDEEVETKLQALVEEQTVYTDVTDRPVADGDVVTIDFVLKVSEFKDGFVGGPRDDYRVRLDQEVTPIYADSLIGHQIGDTYTWNGDVPEDYYDSLIAGQYVSYDITIKAIQTADVPDVDDQFAAAVSETADTVKDLQKELKAEVQTEFNESMTTARANEAWVTVLDQVKISEYPEKRLQEKIEKIAAEQGVTLDGEASGDQLLDKATIEIQAKAVLKEVLAAEQIIKEEGLELSEDQLSRCLEQIRIQYGLESTDAIAKAFSDTELQELLDIELVKIWVGEQSR